MSTTGTLSLTRGLLRWLQSDTNAWAALPASRRAALQWRAMLGSLNFRLARLNAPDPPVGELADPVLVLGPWRSGTTVMHELLAAASGLATPRTWQCMDASAFTTRTSPSSRAVVAARPMDGLAITPDSPQEDEFGLLTLGADSVYRAFWMPHRLPELHRLLTQEHWLSDSSWLRLWEQFLSDVVRSTPQARQPLLLKSPNHSFRLQAILRRFPASRVVWMLRDGTAVFHSNLKMWRAMFSRHGLSHPRAGELEEFIALAMRSCAEVLDAAAPAISRRRWSLIRQARLREEPAQVVAEVFASLQLPFAMNGAALRTAIEELPVAHAEAATEPLPPDAVQAVRAFDDAQARALNLRDFG